MSSSLDGIDRRTATVGRASSSVMRGSSIADLLRHPSRAEEYDPQSRMSATSVIVPSRMDQARTSGGSVAREQMR